MTSSDQIIAIFANVLRQARAAVNRLFPDVRRSFLSHDVIERSSICGPAVFLAKCVREIEELYRGSTLARYKTYPPRYFLICSINTRDRVTVR